jgi:hypothetical protein
MDDVQPQHGSSGGVYWTMMHVWRSPVQSLSHPRDNNSVRSTLPLAHKSQKTERILQPVRFTSGIPNMPGRSFGLPKSPPDLTLWDARIFLPLHSQSGTNRLPSAAEPCNELSSECRI